MGLKKLLYANITDKQQKYSSYWQYLSQSDQQVKWQRMMAILHEQPMLGQAQVSFKKLYIIRLLVRNMVVLLLQFTGLMMATLGPVPAPISFAAGTACAFVFLQGVSVLPGIWLGSYFAYFLADNGAAMACLFACIYTLQTFALLWLSYRYVVPTLHFYRNIVLLKFIFCSVIVTMVSGFLIEYVYFSISPRHLFFSVQHVSHTWLANLNGILIFSCGLIAWDTYFPQIDGLKQLNIIKLCLVYATLVVFVGALLFFYGPIVRLFLMVAVLLFCLIISLYFGYAGMMAAACIIGSMLNFAAYFDVPQLAMNFVFPTVSLLQVFLSIMLSVGLAVAISKLPYDIAKD